MTGYVCNNQIATEIESREPVLCPSWMSVTADGCDCGAVAERLRTSLVGRMLDYYAANNTGSGDIDKVLRHRVRKSRGREYNRALHKARYVAKGGTTCRACGETGHNRRTCNKSQEPAP